MNKKICFIITDYNSKGGTERVLSQIANGLAERNGYDISIVSIGRGKEPHFDTNSKISLYELNALASKGRSKLKNLINRVKAANKKPSLIQNILMQISPDIVITVGIGFYRYLEKARKIMKFKTIAWEHYCLQAYNLPQINKSRYLAVKNADKLVVISDNDLLDYQKKYPYANNLMRIYNPIAFEITNNIDINNKVIVAAGRYVYEKGFDLLIEAWSLIEDSVNDWRLKIFGEGEDRGKLQKLIDDKKLKNIKLCGYAQDLDKEYEKASIFCLSSRYEGWGLVLIEAQAKGLPCVSFNCKQGPGQIIEDGVNGFLVEPNNVKEFSEKLLYLISDEELRKNFSANSAKALDKYNYKNLIDEWDVLLKTL